MKFSLLSLSLLPTLAFAGASLRFEQNLGQTSPEVRYLARSQNQTVYFGDRRIYLEISGKRDFTSVVRMTFPGASAGSQWRTAGDPIDRISYVVGADPSRWVHNASQFPKLERTNLYPGIDAVFYGQEGRLEYDLVLAPGADPSVIRLRFDGDARARLSRSGAIEIATPSGKFQQLPPRIYQQTAPGRQRIIAGRFVTTARGEFALRLGDYDRTRPLTVDPVLTFATYIGGDGDDVVRVVGPDFVAGSTSSVAFLGAPAARRRNRDVFIRSTATTSFGFFGTYVFGGSGDDELLAAATSAFGNSQGEYFLAGVTNSRDLPSGGSGAAPVAFNGGNTDGFLIRMPVQNPTLNFKTILIGGSGDDRVTAVSTTINSSQVIGAGITNSPDLPARFAFQPQLAGGTDAFVFAAAASSAPLQLSYLGGSGDDVAYTVANFPNGILVGGETRSPDFPLVSWNSTSRSGDSDGFLALATISPVTGDLTLSASTLIGGSGDDRVESIAQLRSFIANMPVVFAGVTSSSDLPLVAPVQSRAAGSTDAFVGRMDLANGSLSFLSYIGGSGPESNAQVSVDNLANIVVAGSTRSADLATVQALQPKSAGGEDAFLAYIDTNNSLQQLTYFGGSGDDHVYSVLHNGGSARIAGSTTSADLPVKDPFQESKDSGLEGFVADISTSYITGPERFSLGKDLAVNYSYSVAQDKPGTLISFHTSDPSKVRLVQGGRVASDVAIAGSGFVTFEALDDHGEVEVIASAEGFPAKRITVTLRPSMIRAVLPAVTLTTWSSSGALLNYSTTAVDPVTGRVETAGFPRSGLDPIVVTWMSSDPSVAQISPNSPLLALPVSAGTAMFALSSNLFPTGSESGTRVTVVKPVPVKSNLVLGKDLQTGFNAAFSASGNFSNTVQPRGAITVRSSDPSRLLLARDNGTPGQESVVIDYSNGNSFTTVFAQALAEEGEVAISMESPDIGVVPPPIVIKLVRAAVQISPLSSSGNTILRTTQPGIRPIFIVQDTPSPFSLSLRPGVTVHFTFTTSDPSVLTISPATYPVDSALPSFIKPVAEGTAAIQVSADSSSFDMPAPYPVTVISRFPSVTPTISPVYVGKDLAAGLSVNLRAPSNSEATITVDDPSLALVSDGKLPGQGQLRTTFSDTLQLAVYGLASSGSTGIHINVPGFDTVDGIINLAPSGFAFTNTSISAGFYGPSPLFIAAYVLDDVSGIPLFAQSLRPGIQADISFQQSGDSIALTAPRTTFVADANSNRAAITYTAKSVGVTEVFFDQPSGFTAPSRSARAKVRINGSSIALDQSSPSAALYGVTNFGVSAEGAAGGNSIRVTSTDPSKLLVGSSPSEALPAANVRSGGRIYLTALADSGFAPIQLSGTNLTSLSANVQLYPITVSAGLTSPLTLLAQSAGARLFASFDITERGNTGLTLRPDAPPIRIDFTSTDSQVAAIDPTSVDLTAARPNVDYAVKPSAPGVAEIRASVSKGYQIASNRVPVTVRLPKFQWTPVLLGKDMQGFVNITPEPGGTPVDSKIVTITSLSPGSLLLSRSPDTPGSASLALAYPGGAQQSQPVYLQALSGEGEAQVRISADGFADTIGSVVLSPSTFVLISVPSPVDVGSQFGATIQMTTLLPPSQGTQYAGNTRIRAGAPAITVRVFTGDSAVLALPEQAVTFGPGDLTKSFTVNAAGAGQTAVRIGVPDGYADPGAGRTSASVTVRLRTFNGCPATLEIAKDSQFDCLPNVPAEVTVTAVSSQPSLLALSTDRTRTGGAQAAVKGSGFERLYFQALGDSGTVEVSLTAPGYTPAKIVLQLRPTTFVMSDLLPAGQSIQMVKNEIRTLQFSPRMLTASGELGNFAGFRPGLPPIQIDLTCTNPSALKVPPSVTISSNFTSVQITAIDAGNAAIIASTPPGYAPPPNNRANYLIK